MTAAKITYSTRNLSEDCDMIVPGTNSPERTIESAGLLEKLQRFSEIPAVNFVDESASMSLKGKGVEFVVTNEGGQLYMVEAPTATNSPVLRSPAEIVQFLDDEFSPPVVPTTMDDVVIRPPSMRDKLGSPKLLFGLVAVWAVIFYFVTRAEGPEGVSMIKDGARAADYAAQFQGRYGALSPAGSTVVVFEDGRVKVYLTTEAGVEDAPIMDQSASFGERNGKVVLVVENGAVLDRDLSGSLVFDEEVYPRIP
mgnify:CR=1 FL=1